MNQDRVFNALYADQFSADIFNTTNLTVRNGLDMNSQKITSLGSPTVDSDAANKIYVDMAVSGGGSASFLTECDCATAAALPNAPTYASPAETLTSTAGAGVQLVVDSVNPTAAERVLVKNQTTNTENGIYVVTDDGAGANPWQLTRATDFNQAAMPLNEGAQTFVSGGTINARSGWATAATIDNVDPLTDAVQFNQVSGTRGAGTGLSLSGPNLAVNIGTDVQAYDAGLTSIAGLTTGANTMIYTTAADTYATTSLTAFARTLLDDTNQAGAQTTLGLVPGTDVQAYDAGLTSIAGLTTGANTMIYTTAADTYATTSLTAFARTLLDDANSTTVQNTLEVLHTYSGEVDYATAAVLPNTPTYASPAETLTSGAGAGTALAVDGANPAVGQRVLVKNQATNTENGIYVVTDDGAGANPWELTRAADFNEAATTIYAGKPVFVKQGTANSNTSWVLDADATQVDPLSSAVTFTERTTTLTSAGGTTLVNDGTGPTLAIKGLTAGTGVTLTPSGTDITIDAEGTTTLTSAGGTETLVNDGTGPALAIKGITAGNGISLTSAAEDLTITYSLNASSIPSAPTLLSTSYVGTGTMIWNWDAGTVAVDAAQVWGYAQGGFVDDYKRLMFVMNTPLAGTYTVNDSNILEGGTNRMTILQVNTDGVPSPESNIVVPATIPLSATIEDDFDRSDRVLNGDTPTPVDNGNDWFRVSAGGASWRITSNEAECQDPGNQPRETIIIDTNYLNLNVTVDFLGQDSAFCFRRLGVLGTGTLEKYFMLFNSSGVVLQVWRKLDGVTTLANEGVSGSSTSGDLLAVNIRVFANVVQAYDRLGALILSWTDTTNNLWNEAGQTGIGFRAQSTNGPNNYSKMDNLFVAEATDITYIQTPQQWTTYQRDDATTGTINVVCGLEPSGGFTGVEINFNLAGWVALTGSITDNVFTGSVTGVAVGQGTLLLRATPNPTDTFEVNNVSIGDVYIVAGQSNAEGRSSTDFSYTPSTSTLHASIYKREGINIWERLTTDPTSALAGAGGSAWPLVGAQYADDHEIPIAFICTAEGSTGLVRAPAEWDNAPAGEAFTACKTTFQATGLLNAKAILWFQGERDAAGSVTTAQYKAGLVNMFNALKAAGGLTTAGIPGLQLICGVLGQSGNYDIRQAQIEAINENAAILEGPLMYNFQNPDGVHFNKTGTADAIIAYAAQWNRMLDYHYFSGTAGWGATVNTATKDTGAKTVTVTFTMSGTLQNPAVAGWQVRNDSVAVTIDSVVLTGDSQGVIIQVNAADVLTGTVDVSFSATSTGLQLLAANAFGDTAGGVMPPVLFLQQAVV